jgi:predicted solute-binding protein
LAEETQNTRLGLISPIDYARHAGSYRIVPGIAVSTLAAAGVARLRIRPDAHAIRTLAVDPRATSEVVLASVIIAEKYPAASEDARKLPSIVPVVDAEKEGFTSCDAVLEYHPWPTTRKQADGFEMDLYEEWADMTDLPWVSAFWVMREEEGEESWLKALVSAHETGVSAIDKIGRDAAAQRNLSSADTNAHLSAFAYGLGEDQQDSLREFFQYAFYLGILKDVPELAFFDPTEREE